MSSHTYSIEYNSLDHRFKVTDENGFCFGDGIRARDAIASARIVLDESDPIYYGENLSIPSKAVGRTGADETIYTTIESIAVALAELSGFKIRKVVDDNLNLIGYTMELVE